MKSQNDDLSIKLRRAEAILTRIKEELAKFRASSGRSPFINFDEEQRLSNMLKVSKTLRACFVVVLLISFRSKHEQLFW